MRHRIAAGLRRRKRHAPAPCLLALAGAAVLACAGCHTYGVSAPAGADTVMVTLPRPAEPRDVAARLFLYRTTSRQTGERLGVGRTFEIGSGRQVRAVLQMEGLAPEDPLQIHLLWVNPDGKKAFVKEVWVRPDDWARREAGEEAGQLLLLDRQDGRLELESRYGIDPVRLEEEMHKPEASRLFRPGRWELRVYLFRQRILETAFDLVMTE